VTRDPNDRRILCALRFVDAATRGTVSSNLRVSAEGAKIVRNLSNLYVITEHRDASSYGATFELPEPPAAPVPPAIGALPIVLTIVDPSGRYLPRTATVRVPRDPDPAHAHLATSVFQPVSIELFPSPTMPLADGWATVRVSVRRADTKAGLPFAFIRVLKADDDSVIGRAVADERGEALVAIPGIPVTMWNAAPDAAVTTSKVSAKLAACFDPAAFDATTNTFPDPRTLETAFDTFPRSLEVSLDLTSGKEVARRLDVTIPP